MKLSNIIKTVAVASLLSFFFLVAPALVFAFGEYAYVSGTHIHFNNISSWSNNMVVTYPVSGTCAFNEAVANASGQFVPDLDMQAICGSAMDVTTAQSGVYSVSINGVYTFSFVVSGGTIPSGGTSYIYPSAPTGAYNPTVPFSSSAVPFNGVYNNVDQYDSIQFDVQYLSASTSVSVSPISLVSYVTVPPSIASGTVSYNVFRDLPYVGSYRSRARLYNSGTSSSTAWSSFVNFSLGSTTISATTSQNIPGSLLDYDCQGFDISCYIKSAGTWLLYPAGGINSFATFSDTLQTKMPFNYLYEVGSIIASTSSSVGTSTFPVISLNVVNPKATSTSIMNVDMLSEATITAWIPDPLMALFKLLMTATLWLGFLYSMWSSVIGLIKVQA